MIAQLHRGLANDKAETGSSRVRQFLTFALNGEIYGIGILHIREIIEYANLTVVPLMPDFISGVINLRGNVVPVINLARRFNHQPQEVGKRTSIIIVDILSNEGESVEVGIVVDIVNEVIELAASEIAAPPTFGAKIRADFIQGMGKIDNKLMILLDVDHVLAIDDLLQVIEISEDLNSPADKVSSG